MPDTRSKSKKMTAILTASFCAVLVLIAVGGYSVYANSKRMQAEREWVDHTNEVLTSVANISQRIDRVDYNLQLFAATKERARLKSVQNILSQLMVLQQQVEDQVRDNASQSRHAQELGNDLQVLMGAVEAMEKDSSIPQPERAVLACRNLTGVLQTEEHALLEQRIDESQLGQYRSTLYSALYLTVGLLLVVVLFGFLFREARRRRADDLELFAAKDELEWSVQKLTARAEDSEFLTAARDEMQLCTNAQQAHDSVVRHMKMLLPGTNGATLTINNSRSLVEIVATWGDRQVLMDGFNPDACCGLRAGKARWRKKGKSELHCAHFAGKEPESYLCVPLAAHGETQGFVFLCCDDAATLAMAEERMPIVQELIELASLSIASLNLRAKLEGQSIRDGLTGLFNRHFMEIALERELHRAQRQDTQVALLMIDVDHFKRLNDTFGHEAGDVVLREVTDCFRRTLREEDVICRYGGEEFVVIMPDADEDTAARRAEMVREAVSNVRLHFRGELLGSVTISAGIAVYPESGQGAGDLIRLADGALYRAKRSGRNRVELGSAAVAA